MPRWRNRSPATLSAWHEEARARFLVDSAGSGFMSGLAVALTLFLLGLLGLTLQTLCAEASLSLAAVGDGVGQFV